jgi:DNA-binding SARP family transcriptional activator
MSGVWVEVCGELKIGAADVVNVDVTARWHARALLALLAGAAGNRLPRDIVCDTLWPQGTRAAARNRLYHTVLLLKRALAAAAGECDWITVGDGVVTLQSD